MRNSTLYDQSKCDKNEHIFVPKMASKTHISWKEDEYELQLKEQRLIKHFGRGRSGCHKQMVQIVYELVFPQTKYKI